MNLPLLLSLVVGVVSEEELQLSFGISGELCRDNTTTLPAIPYLTLEEGSKVLRVRKLGDLQGRVKVTSSQGALEFVRLITSPATSICFNSTLLEPIQFEDLDDSFVYGLSRDLEELQRARPGFWGVLRKKQWQAFGFGKPRVIPLGDGSYRVYRWLIHFNDSPRRAVYVEEIVKANGSYKMRSIKREFSIIGNVPVHIPLRM